MLVEREPQTTQELPSINDEQKNDISRSTKTQIQESI